MIHWIIYFFPHSFFLTNLVYSCKKYHYDSWTSREKSKDLKSNDLAGQDRPEPVFWQLIKNICRIMGRSTILFKTRNSDQLPLVNYLSLQHYCCVINANSVPMWMIINNRFLNRLRKMHTNVLKVKRLNILFSNYAVIWQDSFRKKTHIFSYWIISISLFITWFIFR